MLVTTPQITWHGGENGKNDPILTLDVHSSCGILATGGADAEIRVWRLNLSATDEQGLAQFLYELPGHTKTVNVVRFSPDGRKLATASDGGTIVIHHLKEGKPLTHWTVKEKAMQSVQQRMVRSTQEDIYDLCWAPSSTEFATASVDNQVVFWDWGEPCKATATFDSHSNYVQGLAWDPRDKYVVSLSNDRSAKVYARKAPRGGKKASKAKDKKGKEQQQGATVQAPAGGDSATAASGTPATADKPAPRMPMQESVTLRFINPLKDDEPKVEDSSVAPAATSKPDNAQTNDGAADDDDVVVVEPKDVPAPAPKPRAPARPHLFADETVPSFFRRPAWSPDGCLMVLPTGQMRDSLTDVTDYVTHVFIRGKFDRPALELPTVGKASVAVRFCPEVFELKPHSKGNEGPAMLTNLPYRMVYAVLTVNAILVYDTQHPFPLAVVKSTNFAPMTDAAWLTDGSGLVVSSMDGYVSFLSFPQREIGVALDASSPLFPPVVREMLKPYHQKLEEEPERADGDGDYETDADVKKNDASAAELQTPGARTLQAKRKPRPPQRSAKKGESHEQDGVAGSVRKPLWLRGTVVPSACESDEESLKTEEEYVDDDSGDEEDEDDRGVVDIEENDDDVEEEQQQPKRRKSRRQAQKANEQEMEQQSSADEWSLDARPDTKASASSRKRKIQEEDAEEELSFTSAQEPNEADASSGEYQKQKKAGRRIAPTLVAATLTRCHTLTSSSSPSKATAHVSTDSSHDSVPAAVDNESTEARPTADVSVDAVPPPSASASVPPKKKRVQPMLVRGLP